MQHQIGELRERITIERAATADDGAGGETVSWSSYATIWAKVQPVRGREEVRLGRLSSVETYLVVIRHRTDLSELDRVVWRGKTLNIRTMQDRDMDRAFLTIEAEAGVNVNG